jgi:hypothetical protein
MDVEHYMAYFGSVTITNKYGWQKTIDLGKALLTIGSSRSVDINLPEEQGAGAAPLHLQLISPKTAGQPYRIINLAGDPLEITAGPSRSVLIRPRTPQTLQNGDVLVLGEFTLAFSLQNERGVRIEQRSANLGMLLELPHLQLRNEKRLAGLLTLTNYGENRRCQFTIELDGLPDECFRVSPAPLLYPGASEQVEIQFFHRGDRPSAGKNPVSINASASQAYPQETVSITLDLQVEAVNKYTLAFETPDEQPAEMPLPAPSAVAEPAAEPTAAPEIEMPAAVEPVITQADTPTEQPGAVPARNLSPETVSAAEPEPVPEPLPAREPAAETPTQAETPPEDDPSWWSAPPAARAPQRQPAARRDLRSMLAGKDIQVIKAGDEPEETEAQPQQKAGAE